MISKPNVTDVAWFLLADYHKTREEKAISGKELLPRKELAHDGGNLQPLQTVKYTKIRRFTIRKMCSGEKAMGVVERPFASVEDIKCVTHGSTRSSQQKPGTERELSRKDGGGLSVTMQISVT